MGTWPDPRKMLTMYESPLAPRLSTMSITACAYSVTSSSIQPIELLQLSHVLLHSAGLKSCPKYSMICTRAVCWMKPQRNPAEQARLAGPTCCRRQVEMFSQYAVMRKRLSRCTSVVADVARFERRISSACLWCICTSFTCHSHRAAVSHSGRRNEQRHHCCYLVAVRVEKYTACFDAIATGPPCFLQPQRHQSLGLRAPEGSGTRARLQDARVEAGGNRNLIVALDGFGDGVMDHKPHVRLVDSHSKCCGKPCYTLALRVIRFGPMHTTVSAAHLVGFPFIPAVRCQQSLC